jgi:hypothetical protein
MLLEKFRNFTTAILLISLRFLPSLLKWGLQYLYPSWCLQSTYRFPVPHFEGAPPLPAMSFCFNYLKLVSLMPFSTNYFIYFWQPTVLPSSSSGFACNSTFFSFFILRSSAALSCSSEGRHSKLKLFSQDTRWIVRSWDPSHSLTLV